MRTKATTFLFAAGLIFSSCGSDTSHRMGSGDAAIAPVLPADTLSASSSLQAKDLSTSIAAGTPVHVQLKAVVDSSAISRGFVSGTVVEEVKGTDGKVAIPTGSPVTLYIRTAEKRGRISEVDLGLYGVNVLGRQFTLSSGPKDAAQLVFTEDAGLGPGHTAVHLYYDYRLDFKLSEAVQLR